MFAHMLNNGQMAQCHLGGLWSRHVAIGAGSSAIRRRLAESYKGSLVKKRAIAPVHDIRDNVRLAKQFAFHQHLLVPGLSHQNSPGAQRFFQACSSCNICAEECVLACSSPHQLNTKLLNYTHWLSRRAVHTLFTILSQQNRG